MDLTVNEVAERLIVTPLTVRRWLNAGALSGMQLGDRAGCRISEGTCRRSSMRGCEAASRNDRTGQTEQLWARELTRG